MAHAESRAARASPAALATTLRDVFVLGLTTLVSGQLSRPGDPSENRPSEGRRGVRRQMPRCVRATPCGADATRKRRIREGNAPGRTRTSDLRFQRSADYSTGWTISSTQRRSRLRSCAWSPGASARTGIKRPCAPTRGYRRGGSPAGLYTFRRPRVPEKWSHAPRRRLGSGSPARRRAGFPEFTRFASTRRRAGPLFRRTHRVGAHAREGNRCSILLSYERSNVAPRPLPLERPSIRHAEP